MSSARAAACITPIVIVRPASARITTPRSRASGARSRVTASPTWTSTSTTATAWRESSRATPTCSRSACTKAAAISFRGLAFQKTAALARAAVVGRARGPAAILPSLPYTWDEPWLEGFDKVVPALLRRFQPTVLVTQDGCDTHYLDPLAPLAATTRIWPHVGKAFHDLAHELCEGRWLALGGGGYAIYEVVPRAWTLLFAEMVERPDLAAAINDAAGVVPQEEAQERVWAALRKDLAHLGEVHGLELS